MAVAYSLGVFNDNFYKQAAMLIALVLNRNSYQGLVIVLFTLPFIFVAAPAGWLADRFPKRNVVIAAKALEVVAAVCGAVGVLFYNWPLILAMVFLMGLQATIFSPSLNGSIPELYPPRYVMRANAILKMCTTASILLGVALAGMFLSQKTMWWLSANAGQWLVAAAVVGTAALGLIISLGVPHKPAANPRLAFPWTGPADTFRQLRQIRKDRLLATVVLADVFVWMFGSLQIMITNYMGIHQFGYGEQTTGLLIAAELVGIAAGGLVVSAASKSGRWRQMLGPAAYIMGAAMLMVSLAIYVDASSRFAWLAGWLALGGAAGGVMLIPLESFIQVRPAPEKKARSSRPQTARSSSEF